MFKSLSTGLENSFIPKGALEYRSCLGFDWLDYNLKVCQATVTRTTTYNSGDTLTAASLNAEFNNLLNALALGDSDVSGGLAASKISGTAVTLSGTQTLTNKTLTTPIIASISNSGTITIPTGTDTLVGRTTTDTLTNKLVTAVSGARVSLGSAQNSTAAGVVVNLDTEQYDLNSEFASYTFTAKQVGYYLVTGSIRWQTTSDQGRYSATIRRNGSDYALSYSLASGTGQLTVNVADIIYLNGTTDYLTFFATSPSTEAMATDATATYIAIMKIG